DDLLVRRTERRERAGEAGLAPDHKKVRTQPQASGRGLRLEFSLRIRAVERVLEAARLAVFLQQVEIRRREPERLVNPGLPLLARAIAAEHDAARAPRRLVKAADLDDE